MRQRSNLETKYSILKITSIGHHKANGQYGKLVVREPDSNDPNSNLYDIDSSEHVIIGSDWTHDMAEMYVPGLQSSYVTVQSVLINGKGRYYDVL